MSVQDVMAIIFLDKMWQEVFQINQMTVGGSCKDMRFSL
jgi:hypothetical protein